MPEENAAASSAPQKKTVSKARAAHIAQLKRKRRAMLLVILSLFLTFYIALSLIVGLWVYISFNHVPGRTLYGVRTVKYVGTKNTEKVITSAGSDVSNRGYGLYISASDLNKLCNLSFAGDDESGDFFGVLERGFHEFLKENSPNLNKCEFYIPLAVQMFVDEGGRLRVYSTPDKWFGVTYITDKPVVIEGIAGLTDAGLYPRKLW